MSEKRVLVLDDCFTAYPDDQDRDLIAKTYGCRLEFVDPKDPIETAVREIEGDHGGEIAGVISDSFENAPSKAGAARMPFWHIERLRKLRPSLLIAVYSGTNISDRARLAREAGADVFISKGEALRPFYEDFAERIGFEEEAILDRYWKDLPKLLETKFGEWVVVTRDGEQNSGPDEIALHEWCRERGLRPGEYLVAPVLPDQPEAEVPADWLGR